MEKQGVIEPGVTPPEGDEGQREKLGTLADYQNRFGEKIGTEVFAADREIRTRLEQHPATRLSQAAEQDTKKD